MIEQRSIDEVLGRADIVEVAQKLIPDLKKKGAAYSACSPWTNEKSPSFHVVPAKQIFKCFSSGKGGGVINLLMEKEGLDYPAAIQWLADFYSITLEFTKNKELTEETKDKKEQAQSILNRAQRKYVKELKENASPLLRAFVAKRMLTDDELAQWGIGFAPDNFQTITPALIEQGIWKIGNEIGITREKNTKKFDTLVNRMVFPIYNEQQVLLGFGGRVLDDAQKPKYVNPKDSFCYDKSRVLYGLNFAKNHIQKEKKAFLAEGYMDVISCHKNGLENTVASCGTAVTPRQVMLLKRYCQHVVLLMDGDAAGIRAAEKAIDLFLEHDFKVELCLLPDEKDPDDFFNSGATIDDVYAVTIDAVQWKIERHAAQEDIDLKQLGLESVCRTLNFIKGDLKRGEYEKTAKKAFSINAAAFKKEFERASAAIRKEIEQASGKKTQELDENEIALPADADREMFNKFGFYSSKHQYYFPFKGVPTSGSNFIVKPLYHVVDPENDRRILEVSRKEQTQLIDVPSVDLISFAKFRSFLFTKGPFIFKSGVNESHYMMLITYLVDRFEEAIPINILGQQREEFWAYADGISFNGTFTKVNDMGMVKFKDKFKNTNGDDVELEKTFFLPTFSKMYANTRDNDMFENDRKMKYLQAPINFFTYAELLITIYGEEKGLIGIAFLLASHFRDLFISKFNFFPLLFCYGEKGSGKSAFSNLLQNFFFDKQEPLMLNSGTAPGFHRRLAQVANAITFCDEYTDDIDEFKFQALKGAWNGVGREKAKFSNDKRTVTDKVSCSLIIGGQYLPSRDDFSLNDRSISLEFKKQNGGVWPKEQADAFRKLEKYVNAGLNSICTDIHQHRPEVKANLVDAFNLIDNQLKKELAGQNHRDRNRNNYACLLAVMHILKGQLDWEDKYQKLYALAVEKIVADNEMISDGEGLSEYWGIVSDLMRKGIIKSADVMVIDNDSMHLTLNDKKGNSVPYSNENKDSILLISINNVHGDYSKEFRSRNGRNGINRQTIKSYLESRPYFIGKKKSQRFGGFNTSCYVFNYTMMNDEGIYLVADVDAPANSVEGDEDGNGTDKTPF